MNSLTICGQNINVVDNFYSLNDFHKLSGGENKHKPSYFMQNDETKALIKEINNENSDGGNPPSVENKAFRVVKGGNVNSVKQGTYVCKELVYRYAMWISAKFSLMVIRAFDSMVSRSDSQQREILVKACSKLAIGNMLISDVYLMVGKQFGYEGGIKDIPTPLLPEAIAFVYEMILRSKHLSNFDPDRIENINKVSRLGMAKVQANYENFKLLQKALTDIDYAVKELEKNNATHYSVFESTICQSL